MTAWTMANIFDSSWNQKNSNTMFRLGGAFSSANSSATTAGIGLGQDYTRLRHLMIPVGLSGVGVGGTGPATGEVYTHPFNVIGAAFEDWNANSGVAAVTSVGYGGTTLGKTITFTVQNSGNASGILHIWDLAIK